MKYKFTFLILTMLTLSIISNLVSADMGPKPTADISLEINGELIEGDFYARMLTCNYQMKYKNLIEELTPLENSNNQQEWYNKCEEIAPDYGFESRICYGELQQQRGMTNLSKDLRCELEKEICEKLNQKISDEEKECYWTVSKMAWGGNCKNSTCNFWYFLPSEFRLLVYLPTQDKLYLSNQIERKNFRSTFEANLISNGSMSLQETNISENIEIKEDTSFSKSDTLTNIKRFFLALAITLIIEFLVALAFISYKKIPKKILISVLISSVFSLPIVWFVFTLIPSFFWAIFLGEIFAFVFESYFIYSLNKKTISLKESLSLSFLMNLASFLIGGIISLSLIAF